MCSESYFWNSIEVILRIFRIIWRISEYLLSLLIFEWEMADIRISARSHTEIPPSVLWGQSVKIVLLKLSKHHLLSPLCCSCQVSNVKREQLDGFFSQFLLSASGVGGGGGGVLGGGVLYRARPDDLLGQLILNTLTDTPLDPSLPYNGRNFQLNFCQN